MKRFLHIISIAFICGILVIPPVEAQNRRNAPSHHTERTTKSPSSSRQSRTGSQRSSDRSGTSRRGQSNTPSSGSNRPNDNSRPGNSNNNRPGQGNSPRPNQGGNNTRPNDNKNRPQADNRPSNRPSNRPGSRPNHPQQQHHPAPRPNHSYHVAPAPRPHRPVARPWSRPMPPRSWRPYHGCPTFSSILGITFGTALGISLDYLYNHGYTVDSYGNDVVYLRDINEMAFFWPDATLYYGPLGLQRSEFIYSTGYYDLGRYNSLYNSLVARYGAPVNLSRATNSFAATWFGYNNGYITIEYRPMYTNAGSLRYYTTLTYGN